jgi:hypothetical protein
MSILRRRKKIRHVSVDLKKIVWPHRRPVCVLLAIFCQMK